MPSPLPTKTVIRAGHPQDAARLGELMTQELQTRFSHLGQGVVTLLHRHMTTSQYCVCVVAERDACVIGYAAVLTSGRGFYRDFLLRKGLLCGLLALPRMLSLSNIRTVITAMTYFPKVENDDPDAELISVVVDRNAQGSGVGRDLWNAIVTGVAARGIPALKIATDVANERANHMYQNRGCRLVRKEPLYHDTEVNVYVYRLEPDTVC